MKRQNDDDDDAISDTFLLMHQSLEVMNLSFLFFLFCLLEGCQ